jgi:hypothetical protein
MDFKHFAESAVNPASDDHSSRNDPAATDDRVTPLHRAEPLDRLFLPFAQHSTSTTDKAVAGPGKCLKRLALAIGIFSPERILRFPVGVAKVVRQILCRIVARRLTRGTNHALQLFNWHRSMAFRVNFSVR